MAVDGGRRQRGERKRSARYRAEQARVLRERGLTYEEIASALGYADRSAARKAVERGRAVWMLASDEDARRHQLERFEAMITRLEPLVDCADPDLNAMELMRRLLVQQARLLGLDHARASRTDTAVELPRIVPGKARMVQEYMTLADKVIAGIRESGIGSGVAPASTKGYDDENVTPALSRSRYYESPGGNHDGFGIDADDVPIPPAGQWHDGRFYPDDPLDMRVSDGCGHASEAVRAAFEMPS